MNSDEMSDDNENELKNEDETNSEHETKTARKSTKSKLLPRYEVNRTVLFQENVHDLSLYEKPNKNCLSNIKHSIAKFNLVNFMLTLVPILKWLPKYSFKNNIVGDLTAGMTVAVMHIPQGMAYGLLAGVTPSSGLYMAFFPTLAYFVFGTSRHISVGTLSVISLMTLKIVQTHATITPVSTSPTDNNTLTDGQIGLVEYTPIQVVTAVAFMCGMQQIVMSIFQLGNLATLLSEPLVNGFTTGAAVHVTVSQLKDLFGIKIPNHKGAFKIIFTVVDCIKLIPRANLFTVMVIIIFMVLMNEIVKPRAAKLFKFPVPAELIAVVGGTAASFLLKLEENYKVHLVGDIPIGLPAPVMPPVDLLWLVAVDAIAISIVSYSVTISMAMIFAKKQSYEVNPNQEMLALGFSNIIGGLFSCVPNGTSLSRSLIQEQTGGKTQIASVVSAALILIVLLWIGPLFEVLPRCVLSGIIVVALKGMYVQAAALSRFYKEGKLEALSWIVTFIAVVLVDVDIGFVLGLLVSITALYIKGWKIKSSQLGEIPDTGIYVDIATHRLAKEIESIKIFQFTGALNFASGASFKKSLYETISVTPKTIRKASLQASEAEKLIQTRSLIIDLSSVTHLDIAGCKILIEIQKEIELFHTQLLLTNPNDKVFDAINHAEVLGVGHFLVMASVHDAVLYAKATLKEII